MKYRTLGSTDLRVSVVGMGTWQFGGEWGKTFRQDEVDAMFRRGKELGINLIDTAECYGDHTSEAFIGRAIEYDHSSWVICTKFGHKFNKPFDRSEPRSPKDVREQLEASLRALRTDYVDVLQYHSWGNDQFFEEDVLAELLALKREGKFLHLGNSVGSNTNVEQVEVSKRDRVEVLQIVYNRLDRAPEAEVFPLCQQQNLGVLARVPLASGLLSGRYKPGHQFDKDEVRGRWGGEKQAEMLEKAQQIKREEYEKQVDTSRFSMAEWALGWVLQHPAVTAVIPGCKSVEQVESNAKAAEIDLFVKDDHPQAVA